MVIISSTELKDGLESYSDMVKNSEAVITQRGCTITDEDMERGLTADELLKRVRPRIKKLFEK
jgi:hypothetical protein